MQWHVTVSESVLDDLRWFGKKEGRWILRELEQNLSADPLVETRNVKTLRANPIAHKELRLAGKYRVLFNLDETTRSVQVILVGEKRGNRLLVRGEEFTVHHESDSPE
jgi:mRNA-degrading endonuclease RelE of RelBE toxin-antitoxin system